MLELDKIAAQIDAMGHTLAQRARRHERALKPARELLRHFAAAHELLHDVAQSAAGRALRCAAPGPERLDLAQPAADPPGHATLVAADGSQIYPDAHGLAFYYLLNVGTIIYRHGSGQAPEVGTLSRLAYADDEVYPDGRPVSADLIGAERALAEARALVALATLPPPLEAASAVPPCLALSDGPLILWLQRADLPQAWQARILDDYLHCLDRLRAATAALAGFVSRPRSAEVVALLYLAQLPPEERDRITSLADTPYRGLTDRALFCHLPPGHRSALFLRGTPSNDDYRARGHTIYFFYLNTGAEIARVEVPEWVACDPARLPAVHALIHDQCGLNQGYPYILTRADELAVIHSREREVFEEMLVQAMARHGLPLPELSRKALQKQVARWRR